MLDHPQSTEPASVVGVQVCPDGALQHSRIGHLRHDDVAGVEAGPDDCWPVALGEGQVFELNNALPHKVTFDTT